MTTVQTDLVTSAAGTHSGTAWTLASGLELTGLSGTYTTNLLKFAVDDIREWRLHVDVREIQREPLSALAGTTIGDPDNRFASVASRETSAVRPGSDFVTIGDVGSGLLEDDRGRIGGAGGAIGSNTLCRVLVAWSDDGVTFGDFETWTPQKRGARAMRVQLQLWRVSDAYDIQVRELSGAALADI